MALRLALDGCRRCGGARVADTRSAVREAALESMRKFKNNADDSIHARLPILAATQARQICSRTVVQKVSVLCEGDLRLRVIVCTDARCAGHV